MRAVCCYANVGGLDAVAVGAVAVSTWVDCDAAGNVVKVLVLCTQMLRVWLTYDVADAGANVLYANAGV